MTSNMWLIRFLLAAWVGALVFFWQSNPSPAGAALSAWAAVLTVLVALGRLERDR